MRISYQQLKFFIEDYKDISTAAYLEDDKEDGSSVSFLKKGDKFFTWMQSDVSVSVVEDLMKELGVSYSLVPVLDNGVLAIKMREFEIGDIILRLDEDGEIENRVDFQIEFLPSASEVIEFERYGLSREGLRAYASFTSDLKDMNTRIMVSVASWDGDDEDVFCDLSPREKLVFLYHVLKAMSRAYQDQMDIVLNMLQTIDKIDGSGERNGN